MTSTESVPRADPGPTPPLSQIPAADLWGSTEVRDWLKAHGRPLVASTWRVMVHRGRAPQPAGERHGVRLWWAPEIRYWHAQWLLRRTA